MAPFRGGLLCLKECRIIPQPYDEIYNRFSPLDRQGRADAELIRTTAVAEGLVTLREAAVRKMLNGENTFDEIIKGIAEKTQVARGMRLQTLIMSRPLKFIFHGKFYCFHS